MTSSSERVVIRGESALHTTPLLTPDLRSGPWTRLGSAGVRGDVVIEDTLSSLADQTRAAAHAQGYSMGWAQGMREADAAATRARHEDQQQAAAAEARREAEHAAAVSSLQEAACRFEQLTASAMQGIEDRASDLAMAVTSELLHRRGAEQGPEGVVRRVLDVLPEGLVATVRLHPSSARSDLSGLPSAVTVVADASLGPADALVELPDHIIDLRLEQALTRIREVLA